jgi:hypothetical protein
MDARARGRPAVGGVRRRAEKAALRAVLRGDGGTDRRFSHVVVVTGPNVSTRPILPVISVVSPLK